MIKSEKFINRDGSVTYYLYDGKDNFLEYTVKKGMDKLGIIDAYTNNYTEDAVYDPIKIKKQVLKALGQLDEDYEQLYRLDYPWGGKRKNAGRKKGSLNKNKRKDRTEMLKDKITIEEKNLLKVALKYYRKEIATNPKTKQEFDLQILKQCVW